MLLQPRKHVLKTFVHSRLLGIVELQKEKDTEEKQCQRRQMVCLKLRRVSKKLLQGQSSLRRAIFALTERSPHFLTCLWAVKIEPGTFLSS